MDIAIPALILALVLYICIRDFTRQHRRQAEEDRKVAKEQVAVTRALVSEVEQLRKRLDSPVKVSIIGRVVTVRP